MHSPDAVVPTLAIGVDVGGSGIKVGVVDVGRGELVSPRLRVVTPLPSGPAKIVPAIIRIVGRALKQSSVSVPPDAPVGIGVPCVVVDGVTKTAANIDASWVEFDADRAFEAALKRGAFVLNDADAAGLAEMRFGAGAGEPGVVFVLTLGTGVGSGMFNDGVLVPNTELGHMEIRGRGSDPSRTVVEGLGGGPRRAPPRDRQALLAEPHHSWRRRQQAIREVHPAPDRSPAGRSGELAQRCRDRRGGDGRRGARHGLTHRAASTRRPGFSGRDNGPWPTRRSSRSTLP